MIQRLIGVSIGALITFAILWLSDVTNQTDLIPWYFAAAVIGAIASFLWPVVIGFGLAAGRVLAAMPGSRTRSSASWPRSRSWADRPRPTSRRAPTAPRRRCRGQLPLRAPTLPAWLHVGAAQRGAGGGSLGPWPGIGDGCEGSWSDNRGGTASTRRRDSRTRRP